MPTSPAARYPRLALILLCLLLWLPGLWSLPPGDRDESRFVQATKQMLETGDWVRIRNGEEDRNRKPIGIHWLQLPFAAAAHAAGIATENPVWPYRLPSLLGALAAVLAVFETGCVLFDRRQALLAGALLAPCVILAVEAHIAKTDAALAGSVAVAMAVLARAWMQPARVGRGGAATFWLAMGVGVLLKGPIGPMVVGLAVLVLSLWERRWAWLRALRPGWGVPLMLAVVLPWFVAIGTATQGRFFADAVGGDLGRKLSSGDDSHWGPPGLHLLLLPLLAFPASLPVLAALPAAWRTRRDPALRFLLAWVVPSWLVFEAAPTKLPHYTLPLYPALMLLAAWWLTVPRPARGWWPQAARALTVLAGFLLAAGAVAVPVLLHGPWWLGVPGLLAAGLVTWFAVQATPRSTVRAALAAVPLYAALLWLLLPGLDALWISPRAVAALGAPGMPAGRFGAVGFHEPSLRFLGGTDAAFLATAQDGAAALASRQVVAVLVSDRDRAAFAAAAAGLGLPVHLAGSVSGFNYSRGRWVTLDVVDRP